MSAYLRRMQNNLVLLPTKWRSVPSMGEDFLQMLRACTTFTVWLVSYIPNPYCEWSILTPIRTFFVSLFTTTMTTTTIGGKDPSRTTTISSAATCVCFLHFTLPICLWLIVSLIAAHCLDILRQELMCTVDSGVLGQIWIYPENPEPYVDFNTQHRCKNFDAVRRWAEENQLPQDPPSDFLQAPSEGDRIYSQMP